MIKERGRKKIKKRTRKTRKRKKTAKRKTEIDNTI